MLNPMNKSALSLVVLAAAALVVAAVPDKAKNSSQSHWASADDPVARYMIDMERQWAESGCTQQPVAKQFLADDFQGTAPDGSRYNKEQALQNDLSLKEHGCRLDEARVRFFGATVALVYGSERAIRKDQNGKDTPRCLVWTDTWIKRENKWEIISAQDTAVTCK